MNGYSELVIKMSDVDLERERRRLSELAKYSGPAQNVFWLYRAVLEEVENRKHRVHDRRS